MPVSFVTSKLFVKLNESLSEILWAEKQWIEAPKTPLDDDPVDSEVVMTDSSEGVPATDASQGGKSLPAIESFNQMLDKGQPPYHKVRWVGWEQQAHCLRDPSAYNNVADQICQRCDLFQYCAPVCKAEEGADESLRTTFRSGDEIDLQTVIEGLELWATRMNFEEECYMLRTLNPLYLAHLVTSPYTAKLMEQLLEARRCCENWNESFYYDMLWWERIADPDGVRSYVTPVDDKSPNVATTSGFNRQIEEASDFQEGFITTTATYAIQLLADKLDCIIPDGYNYDCQNPIEDQWLRHLGAETSTRNHREYFIDQAAYGLECHVRKLIFCTREKKLLYVAAALPLQKSYLCKGEIKERQRQLMQSETKAVSGRWRKKNNPEEKPPACSGNGLAGGGSEEVALLDSPRPSLVPVWKTIEVPDPPGDLWDWETPWPFADAFQQWDSNELVSAVRCDKSRKESIFLCAQQMLRKKFDL